MWPWKRRKPVEVVLYTRQGCHLCDDAKAVLQAEGLGAREVDVDSDPDQREKYGECVPVVVIDGKVRFRGRVNRVLLRRLLRD
jgi:glutaredoxin